MESNRRSSREPPTDDDAGLGPLEHVLRSTVLHDRLPATIWTVDRELRITTSVGEGLRLLDLPADHTIGRTLYEHFATSDRSHPAIAAHLRALGGVSVQYEGRTAGVPTLVSVHPIRDDGHGVVGAVAVSVRLADRRPLEMLQRESEDLFRQFTGSIDKVVWISDASLRRLIYVSPPYEAIWGRSCKHLLRHPERFLDAIHADDRALVHESLERHRRGESAESTYRIVRPDGTIRWIRDCSFPIRDAQGRIYRVAGIAEDVTDRHRAATLVGLQHRILEQIAQGEHLQVIPATLCREIRPLLPGSSCVVMQLRLDRLALSAGPDLGSPWRKALTEIALGTAACGQAVAGGEAVIVTDDDPRWSELAGPLAATGLRAWWSTPIRAASRSIVGTFDVLYRRPVRPSAGDREVLASAADLAGLALDRKRADTRWQLMVRELDHRVKNNLAAVISLARQTADSATSLDDFLPAFYGRIRSMAIAHELLARSQWEGAKLTLLAQQIVVSNQASTPNRVSIDGPPRLLSSDEAPPLCMVLNELTVNAAKHGALSVPDGRVRLSWTDRAGVDEPPRLHLEWTESGGPPIDTPRERGLGLTLIEGLVVHQMRGRLSVRFRRSGLQCLIDLPAPRRP